MIKSWMVIAGVAFAVALGGNLFLQSDDLRWFQRLRRPSWLVFERLIPLIWTIVFIGLGWSAVIVWEQEPGTVRTWLLMGLYLLVEVVTMAYTSVTCKTRSLQVGTIIGGTGAILCVMLAISILPISQAATLLLLPYILWSPIGTFVTWRMAHLNPADA
ncbi:MAG: TspO/MBR family protein [Limnoraphis robusta]|uniref:TspO/MBR family protein n=1 Tax=Limnoraphis robusta CCNP1315 TaxID=3110306 RepID=A0ABU5U5F7_9CYAN|nr:TspO/MBR family protein [Limnoraphis robusta]MEA5501115.1 TspO/MBR family protein [Limnoraphis robusta BA-68 BA1]MEA5522240.1 TspO/MBR family protein [Limnoraphis robusta CCNP1315]MEA5542010.1 TspO/MBR family protein [Limnoraphis robusta Tam1]MEA5545771.1 TspO/MBR family protein [Limnoraphis robusta CCNP1324]